MRSVLWGIIASEEINWRGGGGGGGGGQDITD